jgi:transposase
VSYIYKALIRRRRTGEVSASSRRGHRPRKLSPRQETALAAHIEAQPDLTLAALQAWLLDEHGVRLSNGAMWSAVARLGLSFKKRRSARANKTARTSRRVAASGRRRGPLSIPTSLSSSTRPAPAPSPSGVGRLSLLSGVNDASIFDRGVVRESVHKFVGYGHKQGAAATPIVA